MSLLFHEISEDMVDAVLQHGLVLGKAGTKTDTAIAKTDEFLNASRPSYLIQSGVDRELNNYCYLSSGNKIIDITSGEEKSLKEFIQQSSLALLQIEVDPVKCYVSDLDLFDQIMNLLQKGDRVNARRLAPVYWDSLRRLVDYNGEFRRPEALVTYNVKASAVARIG